MHGMRIELWCSGQMLTDDVAQFSSSQTQLIDAAGKLLGWEGTLVLKHPSVLGAPLTIREIHRDRREVYDGNEAVYEYNCVAWGVGVHYSWSAPHRFRVSLQAA